MTWPKGSAKAIGRSLDVYYRDAARVVRMDRLNAEFVRAGDLVFDIGAHVGDRTASFRRLGARVVAVEPQPAVHRALHLIHGRDPAVHLVAATVGAEAGVTRFYVNTANPTVSTAAQELVDAAPGAVAWADEVWDQEIETPMTTLDALIAQHGVPSFLKIDVEGFEAEVLRGLHHPIPALSFEFTTLQRDVALDALQVLGRLGPYAFNYSLGETHSLVLPTWVQGERISSVIVDLAEDANSGDIYARLCD